MTSVVRPGSRPGSGFGAHALTVLLAVFAGIATASSSLMPFAIGLAGALGAVVAFRGNAVFAMAFAVLPMAALRVPGTPLPVNEMMMALAIAVALVRAPSDVHCTPRRLIIGLLSVGLLLTVSTLLNSLMTTDALRRLAHVALFIAVAIALGRGQIPRPAAMKGLRVGLTLASLVGVVTLATGFGPEAYPGRLTGLFGDPNVAGFSLTVLGPLALGSQPSGPRRRAFGLLLVLSVVATLSRTAILVMAIETAWMLVGRRLRPALGVSLLAAIVLAIAFLPVTLQSAGPFADRTGSDQLRQRIIGVEIEDIRESPIVGAGASTATVVLEQGQRFFYHNSFFALVREGGIVTLVPLASVLIAVFLELIRNSRCSRQPWIEVAMIAVVANAMHLGEVLLEIPTAVAIGLAATTYAQRKSATSPGDALQPVGSHSSLGKQSRW